METNKIYNENIIEGIKKIDDNSIDLIINDPPYINCVKAGWDKKEVFNEELCQHFFRVLKNSGSIYTWCGIGEKSQSLIRWFPILGSKFTFKDLITWKKNRGIGTRRGWLYTREELMWHVKDNKKFVWNVESQYSDEKRPWNVYKKGGIKVNKSDFKRITNVWTDINEVGYGSCPTKYSDDRKSTTPKPCKISERIIESHTHENNLVLVPFVGSGNDTIVCRELKRNFIGFENDENQFNYLKTILGEVC